MIGPQHWSTYTTTSSAVSLPPDTTNITNTSHFTDSHPKPSPSHDVVLTLRLPTLLHPSIATLQEGILRTVQKEVALAAMEKAGLPLHHNGTHQPHDEVTVHIEVRAKTPIPFVRNVEEEDDVVEGLGPGLANVAHFLAVYSCKVRLYTSYRHLHLHLPHCAYYRYSQNVQHTYKYSTP